MPPVTPDIREILFQEIIAQTSTTPMAAPLTQTSVLDAAARKLAGIDEQAILTQRGELFRTGLIAWGLNISNPNAPFFHLTERGKKALENATRDPSNPAGYMRHLDSVAKVNDIARSYLVEGLECYAAGFFRAAAVMVGAAAESVVLEVRDTIKKKLSALKRPCPKAMEDWRIKTVTDATKDFLDREKGKFAKPFRDQYEAYWSAFAQQIRAARNDAGHPTSVDPVTPDTIHASLLIFPELGKLGNNLIDWVSKELR